MEEAYSAKKKFPTNYSKQLDNETRELHQAKKMVKDLTQRIEESNSRARAQIQNYGHSHQFDKVMKEVESVKRDLSKLKLDMATIFEEKRRAERETDSSMSKALSYSSSVEALMKEIEEINEEHVFVELARIEAIKEYREIEAQRREEAEKHSITMEETRKKKMSMIQDIEDAKELETKLAITLSDISVLESKLKQGESNFHHEDDESITRELEATKKELASIEVERFEFMASMDVIRNELTRVVEEAATLKKKEDRAEMAIQSLNSKLLRAKAKVEASSAAANKAKSTASNLSLTLEQIKSEAEAAEKEESLISEETVQIKKEIEKTETEIESAEERMEAALRDLKAVKSSEAIALEKLKAIIQNTMRNRGLSTQCSKTITISKFEYDYLKGNAAEAIEMAEKKVAAAQAWIEALKASEKEIQIRSELSRRESTELRVEKERDIPKTEGSMTARRAKVRKSASSTIRGRSASFSMRRRK